MKQLILVLGCVVCLCYTTKTFAQSYNEDVEENIITQGDQSATSIILDDKNNESETSIEIKNGKLYVDGKKVSDIDRNTKVKIVKKNTVAENNNLGMRQWDMPMGKSFSLSPRKAMLGVMTENANPGAKINKIVAGSAAEKAGLVLGDIITSIDGKKIESFEDLASTIGEYSIGDKIEIKLYRNDELKKINAELGATQPSNLLGMEDGDEQYQLPFKNFRELFDMPKDGGIVFNSEWNSSPKIGLEIEESADGLQVLSVEPNSAADKAGLQKGDEIITLEGNKINTLNQLKEEIVNSKGNKEIYFGVKRAGAIKSLPVAVPQAKKRAQF